MAIAAPEIHCVTIGNDRETFIFLFTAARANELLATLARFAADPELEFSWHDAAVISQRARRLLAGLE